MLEAQELIESLYSDYINEHDIEDTEALREIFEFAFWQGLDYHKDLEAKND